MNEYIFGNAKVRIHGSYDLEKAKAATTQFLKKAEVQRKRASKQNNRITHEEEKHHGIR